VISFLQRFFYSSSWVPNKRVNLPILSADEVDSLGLELANIFSGKGLKVLVNPKASESIKQGEQASRYLGSGMEYDESRDYQLGDEVRRINWRLMARTGKAYTKLFLEERQESWTILLDKRQSMRFGTRQFLKVQQAIRAMGFFSWQAEKLGLPVELICMDKQIKTSPAYQGKGSFRHLIAFANTACPPLNVKQESSLNDELIICQKKMQAGSRLILISDLHDLDDKTIELLAALQQKIMVKIVLVFDEAEKFLPAMSGLKLQAINGEEVINISTKQAANYEQWAEQYFNNLTTKLSSIGIKPLYLSTVNSLNILSLR
jgi:uncharacterized protein (DUF58 family)